MVSTNGVLQAYVAKLRESLREKVTGVVLFGSRASGSNRPDSDYDIAVFVDDDADLAYFRRVASDVAYPFVLQGYDFRPVVLRQYRRNERSQFLGHIREVGRPL